MRGSNLKTGAVAIFALGAVVILALGLPATASAEHDGIGGLSLRPAPSVKGISMGETGLTERSNAPGFAVNPAMTPFLFGYQVALGYNTMVQGLSSSSTIVTAVFPLGTEAYVRGLDIRVRRFGLGVAFEHQGLELSQGSSWGTETLSMGLGYRMTPYASFGLLGKFLFTNSSLEGTGARAFGFDLTTLLDFSRNLSLSLALRNLGGSASWEDGESESLPLIFSLGGRLELPRNISTELAMSASTSDRTTGGLGFDVPVMETGFSVRLGYLYRSGDHSRNIPTFGFGFEYQQFQLDYAARLDDDKAMGTTHHFSLNYTFGS